MQQWLLLHFSFSSNSTTELMTTEKELRLKETRFTMSLLNFSCLSRSPNRAVSHRCPDCKTGKRKSRSLYRTLILAPERIYRLNYKEIIRNTSSESALFLFPQSSFFFCSVDIKPTPTRFLLTELCTELRIKNIFQDV